MFVYRNRLRFFVGAVILTGIMSGITAATWQGGARTKSAPRECGDLPHGPQSRDCYVARLSFTDEAELTSRLREVELMLNNPTARHFHVECHEVMHEIGKLAASRFVAFRELYTATPDTACMGGFQHGLLETELDDTSDEELSAKGAKFCEGKFKAYDRCIHLLGHVAMQRTLRSREGISPDLTRDVCGTKKLHDSYLSAFHEFRCYDGSYMEVSLAVRRSQGALHLGSTPPEVFCSEMRTERPVEASACIHQMASVLVAEDGATPKTLSRCTNLLSAASPAFVDVCLLAVANFMGVLAEDPYETATVCDSIPGYDRVCYAGFARSIGNMTGFAASEKFCKALRPQDLEGCMETSIPFEYMLPIGLVSALDPESFEADVSTSDS